MPFILLNPRTAMFFKASIFVLMQSIGMAGRGCARLTYATYITRNRRILFNP